MNKKDMLKRMYDTMLNPPSDRQTTMLLHTFKSGRKLVLGVNKKNEVVLDVMIPGEYKTNSIRVNEDRASLGIKEIYKYFIKKEKDGLRDMIKSNERMVEGQKKKCEKN